MTFKLPESLLYLNKCYFVWRCLLQTFIPQKLLHAMGLDPYQKSLNISEKESDSQL